MLQERFRWRRAKFSIREFGRYLPKSFEQSSKGILSLGRAVLDLTIDLEGFSRQGKTSSVSNI
jgi:hypothetical protein